MSPQTNRQRHMPLDGLIGLGKEHRDPGNRNSGGCLDPRHRSRHRLGDDFVGRYPIAMRWGGPFTLANYLGSSFACLSRRRRMDPNTSGPLPLKTRGPQLHRFCFTTAARSPQSGGSYTEEASKSATPLLDSGVTLRPTSCGCQEGNTICSYFTIPKQNQGSKHFATPVLEANRYPCANLSGL